jgi:hypothetical protein
LGLKSEQSTTIECTFSRNDLCQIRLLCWVPKKNSVDSGWPGQVVEYVMKRRSLYASTRFVEMILGTVRVVEATLCSFDCLFEGPALGCEEGLELD